MKRLMRSFIYAMQGIRSAATDQPNIKIMIGIALSVIGAGFYFRISSVEWCIALLCIGMVTGLEMINSALESLVDLVTRERMPLAGRIKDIAAGAVFLVAIVSLVIGVIIFRKYIVQLFV